MEITSIQKNIHNSPRKIRLVVDMIRSMKPTAAVTLLGFTNKAAAEPVSKAIRTALGNAKAQNLDTAEMIFKTIEVNEGTRMKRFRAGTKGRSKPYVKRMSHLKIVLTDQIPVKKETTKKEGDQSKAEK